MLSNLRNFNWTKNMFLVPILLVAGISISHVVSWYDMANPISWAIYLSIAIEVGAMTSLMAATKKIKGGVWFMFGLVTFIQMMGNIFYSYVEIDENGTLFKNWVELTSPIFEMMGTDSTDVIPHKRWLALLEGGLLPLISLTALHFYIKYDDTDDTKDLDDEPTGPSEGPSVDGLPMDDLIGQEPTISVQPNNEPITEFPDGVGPNNEGGTKKNTTPLGKYDLKFGPEYTRTMNELNDEDPTVDEDGLIHTEEEIVEESDEGGLVQEAIEDLVDEEPREVIQNIQPFSQPFSDGLNEVISKKSSREISDDEAERQKHLKFRKRIVENEDGKKTIVYPKRDKITQKIIK